MPVASPLKYRCRNIFTARVHRVSLPGTRFTAPPWIPRQYDEYAAEESCIKYQQPPGNDDVLATASGARFILLLVLLKQDNLFARPIPCSESAGGAHTALSIAPPIQIILAMLSPRENSAISNLHCESTFSLLGFAHCRFKFFSFSVCFTCYLLLLAILFGHLSVFTFPFLLRFSFLFNYSLPVCSIQYLFSPSSSA